ncbi:cytochrome c oxidase assembly protein [Roseibium algae]|uniref:Cytochrome c oxidase assembly protein CtaG n=1 Tax=Roseibium algae TaxID=3123038 RepID=A0ABU8TI62_9HYPH
MSEMKRPDEKTAQRRNTTVGLACAGLFFCMVGAAYAAVPLYNLFCKVTGFGGTTQVAENESERVIDRKITIRFDGNVNHELGWDFKPAQRNLTMDMGETARLSYVATNIGSARTVGTSVFNVTPNVAGAYFNKLECFCFTEQALEAGETVDMPVVFFVDPDMDNDPELDHVKEITLSYTFFPVETSEQPVTARADQPAAETKL